MCEANGIAAAIVVNFWWPVVAQVAIAERAGSTYPWKCDCPFVTHTVYKRGDCGGKKGFYHAAFRDHTGERIRRCTVVTNRQSAREILAKLEADERKRDHAAERIAGERSRTIEAHLAEWKNAKITYAKTIGHMRTP